MGSENGRPGIEGERQPRVLVTGTTGFLGSHFLLWLSVRRPSKVFALVRGAMASERSGKLERALHTAAQAYRRPFDAERVFESCSIVHGDIEDEVCAVGADDLASLRAEGVAEFWHFAASLNFEERKQETIRAQNIFGTLNAFELARAAKAGRFVYVSTAYTAGTLEGDIPETLHAPPGFSNVYEQTKCEAEHLITERCAEAGLPLTILRPSIVIGPVQTKRPGGSTSGLFGFIREIARLKRPLRSTDSIVRMLVELDAELNFIPVDTMMEDIFDVVDTGFTAGDILHLTASRSVRVRTAVETVFEELGIRNLVAAPHGTEDLSPLETLLSKRTEFYGSYLNSNKRFVRSLKRDTTLTEADYRGFVVEGVREHSKQAVGHIFSTRRTPSFDGAELSVYECGPRGAPCLVLVNAHGMPVEFFSPLAKELSKTYRVVTWETRGVPSLNENFDDSSCDTDSHVRDLQAVVKSLGGPAAGAPGIHVLGWCTGAVVALKAALNDELRIDSLVLLNGSYHIAGLPETNFQRSMRVAMPKIAKSRRYAEFFHRTLFTKSSDATDGELQAQAESNSILASTDPALLHLTSTPFQTPEALYRYGCLIREFIDADCSDWLARITQPTLVLTGGRDTTAHPQGSRHVANNIADATLVELEQGDHFALYNDTASLEQIEAFLSRLQQPGFEHARAHKVS